MKTLIVSAAKFESLPLLQELDKKKINYEFFECGIGPLKASKTSEPLSKACKKAHTIFIGTCGAFSKVEKPYLISAKKTLWMPAGVRTGISDWNLDWTPPVSFEALSFTHDLPQKTVFTSPEISFTTDIKRTDLKEDPSEYYENMELYCVGEALKQSAKLDIILGVTNEIGPNSRDEWKANFKKLSEMTRDYVLESLF